MLQRRNTTDSASSSWPICRYYYTHNTGSCDDILLYRKDSITKMYKKKKLKKRRFTYPISLKDKKKIGINEKSNQTARRWSTMRQTNSIKRQTLANILSNISNKKALLPNKVVIDNITLNEKWESIRSYNDTEKVEQESKAGPSTVIIMPTMQDVDMTTTRASTTLTNNSFHTNNSLLANILSRSAGQETVSISMDSEQGITYTEKKSQKEMLLFLFGFLIFPLWWVGAWQYIIQQQDHQPISKHREVFQILNCLMSLASLILVGLITGLSTVWA